MPSVKCEERDLSKPKHLDFAELTPQEQHFKAHLDWMLVLTTIFRKYGRPYQSKVVWVYDWWLRNRSIWLSLSIGDRKCLSLWLRLSIGDWECRSLWLRLSIADWEWRSLWSKKRLNTKTDDCYGRKKDWCLKTIIPRDWRSRISTAMIEKSTCYGLVIREG